MQYYGFYSRPQGAGSCGLLCKAFCALKQEEITVLVEKHKCILARDGGGTGWEWRGGVG